MPLRQNRSEIEEIINDEILSIRKEAIKIQEQIESANKTIAFQYDKLRSLHKKCKHVNRLYVKHEYNRTSFDCLDCGYDECGI